ncbi:lipocalin-like [Xyrauchen texanus]|uniref:lipocalin-like n=1 Tax=Xyrauchen texanus TaxID=154827 RepID=UPI002242BD12|nr:lipocalin-like [Xyrauchen texanus]
MTTIILKLVCVLFCAVFASAEVMPMTDFDLEKMAGKWYVIGIATNAKWFVSHKAGMKVGTAMLVPTEEGDLNLSCAHLKDDGSCRRMTHLAKKTEIPGRFVFFSQRWKNDNDMRVVDAKYDEYAIIHTIKTKGGVSEVLNKLFSRTTEMTENLKEKFTQLCLDTGILEENIAILPPNNECSDP